MHRALDAFEKYIHSPSDLPPLARLALIHYQLEAIHPFLDGNGRIGRMLITLLFSAWELLPQPLLYLSYYLEANRQTYYDRLSAVSARSAWDEWLLFFLQGIATQSRDVLILAQQLQVLRGEYRQKYQNERAAARLLLVVDLLFERPIMTTNQVKDRLEVDFSTAQRYANRLERDGVLLEITGRERNRIYRADAVMRIIEKGQPIQV